MNTQAWAHPRRLKDRRVHKQVQNSIKDFKLNFGYKLDFLPCKIKNFVTFHLVPRNWFALGQIFYNIEFSLCSKLPVKTKKYNMGNSWALQQHIFQGKFEKFYL